MGNTTPRTSDSHEEATLSPLAIRPSAKALHNAFNIGLNLGTNYETCLEQGINVRSYINRVSNVASGRN